MAKMKFLCDTKRCIECNSCVTACKNENDDALVWGIQRRRVVTVNDGEPGENSISVACMHCTDAPCMAVCPADVFQYTEDGIVLHNKDLCIGCGYCLFACPFGAPQFPKTSAFGERGKMDKCTFCAGGLETEPGSEEERKKYGANRIAEGKLPMCAELCSTKALLAGDAEKVSEIFRQRVVERGAKGAGWTNGEDLSYDATKS
ncbi:formate dehydrogenase FDH3 subunit beta [Vibrio sp.]|uniref:formate dehydrogenase FDH3 subunit beta n=1 Tax=Vibrio sp. TaxID=678 RepID=UPI003D10C59E